MKRVVIVFVIAVAALMGWQLYQKGFSPEKMGGMRTGGHTVAVEIAPVTRAVVRDVGTFTGTLLPESQFIVAPKVGGKLEKIFVDIGDEVTRDQLIARIDDDEYVQQVDQARAELDVARANIEENRSALNLARREYERARALREKKIVSESELDTAEAQYKAARAKQKVAIAQVAQREALLKTAHVRLDYTRIRASWENGNGTRVVGERYVDEGTMLTANAAIASIVAIDALTAVIHVIERDYPRVKAGQSAVITTDAYPERTFSGTIARIAPVLKEAARQARVEVDVPNPEKLLKPGMFVRVAIEFERKNGATVVPVSALVKRNGSQGIFLADLEAKRARFVAVQPGITSGDMAEIVEPAVTGYVVTVGQHLLEDGAAIMVPEARPKPSPEAADTAKRS